MRINGHREIEQLAQGHTAREGLELGFEPRQTESQVTSQENCVPFTVHVICYPQQDDARYCWALSRGELRSDSGCCGKNQRGVGWDRETGKRLLSRWEMTLDVTRWKERWPLGTRQCPTFPSAEGKAGSFSSSGHWSSGQSQNVTVGQLSPVWKNEDFWSTLSPVPSRGRCGTVSVGYRDTDPVGALTKTHNPRATQIDRQSPWRDCFAWCFKTILLMIREIFFLLITGARTRNSQAWDHSVPSTHAS